MATATLTAFITVQWDCRRGMHHDVDVDVTYNFDGDKFLDITGYTTVGDPVGIGDWELDELIYERIAERCDDDYADWLSGQDGCDDL